MTPQQTVDLMRLVTQCSPAMRLAEGTPAVWHRLLADLPFEAACNAVIAHYATERRFITPADIREGVARAADLLAPDEDLAWLEAQSVATNEGIGRGQLHPAVERAYQALGGAWGINSGQAGTVRAQFRDAYRAARDRHDREVLGGLMDERLVERAERQEITP